MNGFKKKKVKGFTLGEKIQELREEKRISLNEISRNTQIPLRYLESLEKGEYDELPADVYVRGFLRSCAEYLGADPKILLKYYQREKGVQKNIKNSTKAKKIPSVNLPKISFFTFKIKYFIISMLLITIGAGGFYLYKELDNFISAPSLIILTPHNGETFQKTEIILRGVSDENTEVTINHQPVLVVGGGHFEEKLIIKQGENKITIEAQNRFHKKTIKQIVIYGKFD